MTDRTPTVLMSGAGTGGHLYPGLALAEEIRRRYPTSRIVFAGTGRGQEVTEVTRRGYEHRLVRSAGLKGKPAKALVRGLALLPLSMWDAREVIARVAPDLVVGLGGYSAGAVVLVAAWQKIPTLVLEQNAIPGVTNRLLARFVTVVAVSHPVAAPYFRGKAFVSGNPVRGGFFTRTSRAERRTHTHLVVAGGSQGAHAINLAMMAAAPQFTTLGARLAVTHQTGSQDCTEVRRVYAELGLRARVEPFIEKMVELVRDADVVVCRAGATTLAELAAAGRPSVLVPLPGAADGHQHANADVFVRAGAAVLLPQSDLTGATLAGSVLALVRDEERRDRMSVAAHALATPDAAEVIVDRVEQMAGW